MTRKLGFIGALVALRENISAEKGALNYNWLDHVDRKNYFARTFVSAPSER